MDRDRSSSRRGDEDRGRGRDRDEPRESRGGRGEERETSRGRSRDDDRGGRSRSSGSSRGFSYQGRSRDDVEKRASMGANEFDRIVKDGIKVWSPAKGDNRIRILPPTWEKPKHYGYDIYVHYGVGADRQSYLDLDKMKGEPDPITEELLDLRRDPGDLTDEDLKAMDSKRRVGVWLIDRDDESEGVQFWAMPWTVDKDISVVSVDKASGEVLNIDDPEEGYDVEFRKDGEKRNTKYTGVSIARRSSPLGKEEWLDFAVDNPIPDVLQYYSYDEIKKAFGGGGAHRERDRDREDDRSDRGASRGGRDRDREESQFRDRGRDDDRGSARRGRDDDEGGRRGGRDRDRAVEKPDLTWEAVHEMTSDELDALVESDDRLADIKPNDAKDDEELADWICEDLKLEKAPANTRRRITQPDDEAGDKLSKMREQRGRR